MLDCEAIDAWVSDLAAGQAVAEHARPELIKFALERVGIGVACNAVLDGRFLYANAEVCRQLGYSRDELLQLGVPDIAPDFPVGMYAEVVRQVRAAGGCRVLETMHRRKDGSLYPVEVTVYLHCSPEGEWLIVFMLDISRRRQAEQALIEAKEAAEIADWGKTALLERLEAANYRLGMSDQRLSAMFAMSQKVHELDEPQLLQMGIDEAVRLTGSEIGYLHYVNEDQETIALRTWSASTLRICSAAFDDVFDALSVDRPYKQAWPMLKVLAAVEQEAGRHFEPRLVDHFLRIQPSIQRVRARWHSASPMERQSEGLASAP